MISRWIVLPVAVIIAIILVNVSNRPSSERLEIARRELALAGHTGARVNKVQLPGNMTRCGVSQVRSNRGYAYGWEADTATGVFCFPTDGRPTRILVDR